MWPCAGMQSCFRAHSCAFSLCLSVFLWSHKDQRGELRFTWTHRFHRFLDGSFKSKGARWVCRAPPAGAHRSRWGAHTIWSPSNSAQRKRNTKILGKGELIACLVILLFWGMETVITRHQSSQLEVLIITAAHKREERWEQLHYFVQIY